MPHPLDVEDLRTRVQKALDDHVSTQARRLEELGPDVAPMVDCISDLLRGGKRLRPAFCYWAWRGAGGEDRHEVLEAAASLELFQAAALLHDDVMDDSDTRRGAPSAHRRMAVLHRGNGWTGDGERFGEAAAILAGDLCLSWSDEMLTRSGLPDDALARGREVFDLMRTQLMGGQYLDVLEQVVTEATDGAGSLERARRVIRYKSAKYTVEHPLLLGGALAGADPALQASYSAYGLPLGEAFQLRDDVLGVFGDPEQTGKPAGDDLREGKRTVLVAATLEAASPAQAAAVRRRLGDRHLGPDDVELLRSIIVDTGALDRVEAMVLELVAEAEAALAAADVADPARQVLADLVGTATARQA
ncbi:polyprenyl synthetase family protein [Angustibacter aerolatus]